MSRVLDAGAMINSGSIDSEESYTTPSVMKELKTLESKSLAESAEIEGRLKVVEPSEESLEKVEKKAKEVGSLENLSETDLDVLALAFEENYKVVTDDYAVQNLAAHLELDYEGVIRGEIKEKRRFSH